MPVPLRSTPTAAPAARPVPGSGRGPTSASADGPGCEPRTAYWRFGRPLLRLGLLVLSFPPALLIALPIGIANALQFGPGRVFFRQRRVGRYGREFWILKFRTMDDAPRAAEPRARVTRFGRFLRNTHLDELPQLWNVLRGEMDFIGPRPEMVEIDAWARARIPRFRERCTVRPGLTGLAQITQGYTLQEEHAYRRKLELDRLSISCCSLALDLEILARTALWIARGRGWRRRTRAARPGARLPR